MKTDKEILEYQHQLLNIKMEIQDLIKKYDGTNEFLIIESIVDNILSLYGKKRNYIYMETVLKNALTILLRFKGTSVSLLDINSMLNNYTGEGRMFVNKFLKLPAKTELEQKQNLNCAAYFLENYYDKDSIDYKNTKKLRNIVDELIMV